MSLPYIVFDQIEVAIKERISYIKEKFIFHKDNAHMYSVPTLYTSKVDVKITLCKMHIDQSSIIFSRLGSYLLLSVPKPDEITRR